MHVRKMSEFFLFLFLLPVFIHKSHANGNAILEVISASGYPANDRYCIQYNSAYQSLPESMEDASPMNLKDFSDINGCDVSEYGGHQISPRHTLVAVMRGNCTFLQKAQVAEAKNASALLVIDFKNSSSTPYPAMNKTVAKTLDINLAVIAWHDYKKIVHSGGQVRVSLYSPPGSRWDANMIFITFASTLLVLLGGVWAAYTEKQDMLHQQSRAARARQNGEDDEDEESGVPITVCNILVWFACMCGVILVLYFFFSYVVYVFIALFCIAGAHSLYKCLLPLWTRIMPIRYDIPLNRLPCCKIKSKANLGSLILLMPCMTLGIFWAVERHASYAWVLQDILGACFCIHFIKELRLLSLKIISILLALLLIYDVFFVFITPLLTSDGKSVMVSVATGDNSGSKESVPLVFLIPLFGNSPLYMCRDRAYSLLGFGDVIIPGVLIAYNATCDIRLRARGQQRPWMLYFIIGIIGYLVGIAVCMVSLMLMESGQPALLYLVPCTLIPTITVSLCRKELGLMFRGPARMSVERLGTVESQVGGRQVQENSNNDDDDDMNEVRPRIEDDRPEEEMNLIP